MQSWNAESFELDIIKVKERNYELRSQELRKIAPELDPLRLGTGWKLEDLSKPQIMIESTFGDSHPGSGHLLELVEEAPKRGGPGRRTRSQILYHRYLRRRSPGT